LRHFALTSKPVQSVPGKKFTLFHILQLLQKCSKWGERLVKIGARIVRHGRSISFQMTGVMVPCGLFQIILGAIAALRPLPPARC
jgi:hypothetical protein